MRLWLMVQEALATLFLEWRI